MKTKRVRKHNSIRRNIVGSETKPRLCVFRSNQHIYAQIINDQDSKTLAADSDLNHAAGTKTAKAFAVGKDLAKKALKKGIMSVVFDRGGFLYHGRIKALAEGAREGGLKF